MDDARLERLIENAVDQVRSETDARLTRLENSAVSATQRIASPNYLSNSHPEWSTAAYTTTGVLPSTAGDTNRECYNWYRQTQATTALADTAANALKRSVTGAEHSLWAANEGTDTDIPIWDGVNATFNLGTETVLWDIACPLPTDFIFPGQRFYVSFETLLSSSTVDLEGVEFYCGFWDNTNEHWIRGDEFDPIDTIYGAPGTRTLNYKVLATTDGGEQLLSKEVTVSNAPNVLTPANHVRLAFIGAPGYIRFEVYRKDGTTYRKVADIRNSIDLQFYDMFESAGSIEPGYPSVSGNYPEAKERTVGLTANASTTTPHTMLIDIPNTYDRSATSSQWFRFGLTGHISAARGLVIRRLMVSEGYGPWTRAAADLRAQSQHTASASFAPSPGQIFDELPSNGPWCVTLDTLIDVISKDNTVTQVPISEVDSGAYIACGAQASRVKAVKQGIVQDIYCLTTRRGLFLSCSATHRLVRSMFDRTGVAAKVLRVGDRVLTSHKGKIIQDVITNIEVQVGPCEVKSLSLTSPHLYITNGFVSHNDKLPPDGPILI
jgi:hypothetical protein